MGSWWNDSMISNVLPQKLICGTYLVSIPWDSCYVKDELNWAEESRQVNFWSTMAKFIFIIYPKTEFQSLFGWYFFFLVNCKLQCENNVKFHIPYSSIMWLYLNPLASVKNWNPVILTVNPRRSRPIDFWGKRYRALRHIVIFTLDNLTQRGASL